MFTIETFEYGKHLPRVSLMELSPESQELVDRSSLRKELGFTTAQVLMDALIGSEEAFVVVDPKTRRLLGLFGVAQQVIGETIMLLPWLFTNGFERQEGNRRAFLRASVTMIAEWRRIAPYRTMVGTCKNTSRNFKWLTLLGFKVPEVTADYVTFVMKGKGEPTNVDSHYNNTV